MTADVTLTLTGRSNAHQFWCRMMSYIYVKIWLKYLAMSRVPGCLDMVGHSGFSGLLRTYSYRPRVLITSTKTVWQPILSHQISLSCDNDLPRWKQSDFNSRYNIGLILTFCDARIRVLSRRLLQRHRYVTCNFDTISSWRYLLVYFVHV